MRGRKCKVDLQAKSQGSGIGAPNEKPLKPRRTGGIVSIKRIISDN